MSTSPATLLRLIRRLPLPLAPAPRVLGVDNFAFRKGQHYGTILLDLEDHRMLNLLSEQQTDQYASWLKEHPAVTAVSQDRARVYADGARRGAPNAAPVAVRFHLLTNLGETLERPLLHERTGLTAAAGHAATAPPAPKSYDGDERTPCQAHADAASQ